MIKSDFSNGSRQGLRATLKLLKEKELTELIILKKEVGKDNH